MHPEFKNVFTGLKVRDGNWDWENGHLRLLDYYSRLVISYNIPFAEIREHYPKASFKLETVLFTDSYSDDLAYVRLDVFNNKGHDAG